MENINQEILGRNTKHGNKVLGKYPDYKKCDSGMKIADLKLIPLTRSYVPIPHCLLKYIIQNPELSNSSKMTFLHVHTVSFFNYRSGKERNISSSLKNIAGKISISKTQELKSQKQLEQQGLFTIRRENNKFNQPKPNTITPCVTKEMLCIFSKEPSISGIADIQQKSECDVDYLERTKQFIPFNYGILKYFLEHDALTSSTKILAIDLVNMWHKYHLSSKKKSDFKILINYKDLAFRHNSTIKTISSNLSALENFGIITKKHIFAKNGQEKNARHDRSIWEITLNFPNWYKKTQKGFNTNKIKMDLEETCEEQKHIDEYNIRNKLNSTYGMIYNKHMSYESIAYNKTIDCLIYNLREIKHKKPALITTLAPPADMIKNQERMAMFIKIQIHFTQRKDIGWEEWKYPYGYRRRIKFQ
jgi:hypothetical protein